MRLENKEKKEDDIEKIVSNQRDREDFLEELVKNKEMLKEVFRLYLWETLNYVDEG